MSKRRVTMKDVAEATGLGLSTVSAVLRKQDGVLGIRPETCAKVWKAVRELGYIPQSQARALLRGRNQHVLVAMGQSPEEAPMYAGYLSGVLDEARKSALSVSVAVVPGSATPGEGLDLELLGKVDGVLFFHSTPHAATESLEASRLPCIRLGLEGRENEVHLQVEKAVHGFWQRMKKKRVERVFVWTPAPLGEHQGIGFLDRLVAEAPIPCEQRVVTDEDQEAIYSEALADKGKAAVISICDEWVLAFSWRVIAAGAWDPGTSVPFPWPMLSYEAIPLTQQIFARMGLARLDLATRRTGEVAMRMLNDRLRHDGRSVPSRPVQVCIRWANAR